MSEHFDNYMIHKLTIEDPDEQGDQIFHGIFGKIEESEPHTQVSALAPLVKGASATGTSFVSPTASVSSTDQLPQLPMTKGNPVVLQPSFTYPSAPQTYNSNNDNKRNFTSEAKKRRKRRTRKHNKRPKLNQDNEE